MDRHTIVYMITAPLIPGFKTAVARYCRDQVNGISGGYIRWQSMDTISSVHLECCVQGERRSDVEKVKDALVTLATTLMHSSYDSSEIAVVREPVERHRASLYNSFVLGATPAKVMDVWRREKRGSKLDKLGLSIDGKLARISSLTDAYSEAIQSPLLSNHNNNGSKLFSSPHHHHHHGDVKQSSVSQQQQRPSSSSTKLKGKYSAVDRNVWRDDSYSNVCHVCGVSFGFFTRRHHCRSCGELVCADCSPHAGLGNPNLDNCPAEVARRIAEGASCRTCSNCFVPQII